MQGESEMAATFKRRRLDLSADYAADKDKLSLNALLELRCWQAAIERARLRPQEITNSTDPSPLAVACRSGAPYECVHTILSTAPELLRRVLDSRGTPLHEAIVCEYTGPRVVERLLKTDEELGTRTTPATLLQDVDGFTPLHLLIRRRFQQHILASAGEDTNLMQILEMLVRSCPDAVVIPDRGEYEEPPIVYAIKANIYAPSLGSEHATVARVERQIKEMVGCMLRYNPSAASRVFSGYRGQYSALHSAVFHGRCTDTIELILRAAARTLTSQTTPKACLLQNTQGEIPLHFCAMRGESPRSVALIASAAPAAVLKRDTSGMTPFHWLWVRFVSSLLTLERGGRGTDATISISSRPPNPDVYVRTRYNEFAILEQGDFDADLQLIKRMDPSVDFLRMRHIPVQILEDADCQRRTVHAASVLGAIRHRYCQHVARRENRANENNNDEEQDNRDDQEDIIEWSREEAVVALFWTKVVSLLEAANRAAPRPVSGDSILLHTAFSSKCCPAAVAHLASSLFPQDLMVRDSRGRLPLHCAASRQWDRWDWPSAGGLSEQTATQLLQLDSLAVFRVALARSPPDAVRIMDDERRLVLHHLIDAFVESREALTQSTPEHQKFMGEMLQVLGQVVENYPESLQKRDGPSGLYPFLQATASASSQETTVCDELPLSITYMLLRENPTLLQQK